MASFDRQESRRPSAGPYDNWTFIDNRIALIAIPTGPRPGREKRLNQEFLFCCFDDRPAVAAQKEALDTVPLSEASA